jgi:hypothetical protein
VTRGFAGLLACAIPVFSAVSPEACVGCHRAQTAAFASAAMTHALEAGPRAAILRANPRLAVTIGPYSYEIVRNGNESIYSVTDGKETIRVPIEWAFGEGNAGQTYVFERDGKWYESRVSYFSALHGLDLTLGADAMPRDLTAAAGRLSTSSEMRTCFNCHATNVAKALPLSFSSMVEGVQCERCHGSADAHQASLSPMRHLGGLTTEEQLDFCGQCHRTWSQVSIEGPRGIGNVRFQPYRLTNSRCYDATDNRIRCTACHDPHRPLETSSSAYDARCTACHSKASAHVCRVASANCVTCHMPRLELPGAHQKLTDHRIRIVRANEPYPD